MVKIEGKKALRSKQINLRLTEEEEKTFRQKAENYPSITALIVDAVLHFDMRKGRNRIDTMIRFSEDINRFDSDLARLGNNINQISRVLNHYKMHYIDLQNTSFEDFSSEVKEAIRLLHMLLLEIRKLSNI